VQPERDADHSPPSSVDVKRVRAIPPLPLSASMAYSGTALFRIVGNVFVFYLVQHLECHPARPVSNFSSFTLLK
jgi:hypothetical protein